MKITGLLSSLALACTATAKFTGKNCPGRPVTSVEQLSIFKTFIKAFYVAKDIPTAFQNHVAETYIQHNPYFVSGRQVAQDGLSKFISSVNITVVKISFSDSTGWVLAKQETPGKAGYTAVVDVFRMDGSCVVEHWDVLQPKPATASNPLAMFDGQTFSNAV